MKVLNPYFINFNYFTHGEEVRLPLEEEAYEGPLRRKRTPNRELHEVN